MQWLGIPCGGGFARTETFARIANRIGKKRPDGVFVMADDAEPVLSRLPVSEVWGVGRRIAPKLEALGFRSAWQPATADEALLRKKSNITLAKTARELRGEPMIGAKDPEAFSQNVSCSRSYGYPVTELAELAESVAYYTVQVAGKLRKEGQRAAEGTSVFNIFRSIGRSSGKADSPGAPCCLRCRPPLLPRCSTSFRPNSRAFSSLTAAIRRPEWSSSGWNPAKFGNLTSSAPPPATRRRNASSPPWTESTGSSAGGRFPILPRESKNRSDQGET